MIVSACKCFLVILILHLLVPSRGGTENKEIELSCPLVVAQYDTYMGGVDLSHTLISLYHTKFNTKSWYLEIMAHDIDIYKVNAWLIY